MQPTRLYTCVCVREREKKGLKLIFYVQPILSCALSRASLPVRIFTGSAATMITAVISYEGLAKNFVVIMNKNDKFSY